jgi:transposase-like protein
MDISLNSPGSKKNGIPPAPAFLPGAERREAERSEADQSGAAGKNTPTPPPNPEVVADAKRRRFTMEYKLRILKEADAAKETPGGVGALLRREGLYSSHLTTWRQERDAAVRQALAPKTRGPKPKLDPQQEELQRLRRDNARLADALSKAELIIEVQKKVGSLLGWNLPKTDPEGNS